MSKLIVEMEMPRNCDECEVNYDCAFCGITGSAFYGNTQIPNFMPDKQKLPDCPIVGVLPDEHGDLIDRQDAIKEFEPYAEYESNRTNAEWVERIKTLLNLMPPVIAAESEADADYQLSVLMQEYFERYEPTYNSEDGSM